MTPFLRSGKERSTLMWKGPRLMFNRFVSSSFSSLVGLAVLTSASAQAASLNPVHLFQGADGSSPQAGLVLGFDGSFYGVTPTGGTNSLGVVYKITTGGALTVLYSFKPGTDGNTPLGTLAPHFTYSNRRLTFDGYYGTTVNGGANGFGTIFKISPAGAYSTVYSFVGTTDGQSPESGLIEGPDGALYGTTVGGGTYGSGTAYKITTAGVVTPLHSFGQIDADGVNADGQTPIAGLTPGGDGSFYGVASTGGANGAGTVFKVTAKGAFTLLHTFATSDGGSPFATLFPIGCGKLIGTTAQGGANGSGTIFTIKSDGTFATVHTFGPVAADGTNADGANPDGGLFPRLTWKGFDGFLYGTASTGGANSYGTVYKIATDGTFTTLASFDADNGAAPQATLFEGFDTNLYGTTVAGGVNDQGTVFQIKP